ncbi:MAG: mitochondrial fission ELM1 family protein [Hyphomicrobium sp.]|nr:mitochondrial fission ELM1 family protein [Hyphomicrobium sp.]
MLQIVGGGSVRTLEIALLNDGRPGHYRCAEGVIASIDRLVPTRTLSHPLKLSPVFPGRLLSWVLAGSVSPELVLKAAYGIEPSAIPRPDLIVSSGGRTLAANVALARLTGAPNIFFGSLRHFDPSDFALVLNSYTFDEPRPNQVRILKPCPGDPSGLPAPVLDNQGVPNVAGLLIGGPSGEARFEPHDWDRLIGLIRDTHQVLGVEWIVSNSRRTPICVSDRFAELAAEPAGPVKRYIDVRTAGPGTLGDLFAESSAVVVTADSSAMLSEAIWMQRPAIALRPASMTLTVKEAEYRQWLERQNYCRELPLSNVTADGFASAFREITPLAANPLTDLTSLLADKLPFLLRESRAAS